MYNFGSFDAFIVKPTILPEICSTISIYFKLKHVYADIFLNLNHFTREFIDTGNHIRKKLRQNISLHNKANDMGQMQGITTQNWDPETVE